MVYKVETESKIGCGTGVRVSQRSWQTDNQQALAIFDAILEERERRTNFDFQPLNSESPASWESVVTLPKRAEYPDQGQVDVHGLCS